MNINRNNYEEFFLLYADKELSAEQKQQVETFVRENPDLQQEFNLLEQSKLVADNNIVFENKELLMRSSRDTQSVINHSNYEEFFLLYLDNELSEDDKNAVEKYADKYPSLWHEMMILQKARVEPDDTIVFAGKEKLYRKEKRKIFLISWQRIAVAAAVVLMFGLFISKFTSVKTNHTDIAIDTKKQITDSVASKKDAAAVTSKTPDTLNNGSGTQKELAIKNREEKQERQSGKTKNVNQSKNIAKNNPVENPQQKEPTKQVDDISPVIVKNIDEGKQIETGKIVLPGDAVASITNIKTQDPTNMMETNPQITQTGFNDDVESRDDENSFLAFSTKKSRMRGIFRKVSRVFEKTTNVEGDKSSVLIGNFQIAVK